MLYKSKKYWESRNNCIVGGGDGGAKWAVWMGVPIFQDAEKVSKATVY